MAREKHYLFHIPGMGLEPGDIYAESVEEARQALRRARGLKRLPAGTEVWEETPAIRREREANYADLRRQLAGTGLCVTDF